jgi:DNA-binding GntR family transcriptional regulator
VTRSARFRPPTAQEAVLAELRRAIVQGELRPGTQILQDRFAAQLGLSRVPVREALKILEGEGQVSYEPHRGYFVADLDYEELVEVYRIRELLEAEAVKQSLPLLTERNLELMEEALSNIEQADPAEDIVAITAANRSFHFGLFEPCGMKRLVKLIQQLWDSTDPYRSVYFAEREHRQRVNREHREILTAAREGDAKRLVQVLDRHRKNAVRELARILDD